MFRKSWEIAVNQKSFLILSSFDLHKGMDDNADEQVVMESFPKSQYHSCIILSYPAWILQHGHYICHLQASVCE